MHKKPHDKEVGDFFLIKLKTPLFYIQNTDCIFYKEFQGYLFLRISAPTRPRYAA